jgi:light-regulated signal transduction histidine kinase (bacteriophytochrome)
MSKAQQLAEEYAAQLTLHLCGSSESILLSAYDLGRAAVADGLNVLELVNVHHEALRIVIDGEWLTGGADRLDRAAAFFAETLSPFEMMLRGYRESNANLIATNEKLKEAKLKAETANRELEAFSYSVAHDLRAPLRSVDGFSQMLLEDYADKVDAEGRRYLTRVRSCAQQMAQMIDDLLSLSRVTSSDIRREPIDISAIAREMAARLQEGEPDRQVEFIIADGLSVSGDRGLLTIALQNLIGNAWKYSGRREQSQIEIGQSTVGGCDAIFVRDNGAGFDMAHASRLFGTFQRLHKASEFEGTGVGLATVQRIVQRHGGHIWAEAEVDRGATFFFTLDGVPRLESRTQVAA